MGARKKSCGGKRRSLTARMPIIPISLLLFLMNWQALADKHLLRIATTTSTVNSGLTDFLFPKFEQEFGLSLRVISVGTGKALRLGRRGNADVVLVHAPEAEKKFVAAGYGVDHWTIMYNDFVIAGSADDPAKVKNLDDVVAALKRIADKRAAFVSRGDDSGTHTKESTLWRLAGIAPYGLWYHEAGAAMGRALSIASEQNAYILVDRGTWLAQRQELSLELMVQGDRRLFNPYGVMAVNPAKHPVVNYDGAQKFIKWLVSKKVQILIGEFTVAGERLFTPAAKKN
jgi:tungstate transport system substrate-binding protein